MVCDIVSICYSRTGDIKFGWLVKDTRRSSSCVYIKFSEGISKVSGVVGTIQSWEFWVVVLIGFKRPPCVKIITPGWYCRVIYSKRIAWTSSTNADITTEVCVGGGEGSGQSWWTGED